MRHFYEELCKYENFYFTIKFPMKYEARLWLLSYYSRDDLIQYVVVRFQKIKSIDNVAMAGFILATCYSTICPS